MHQTFLKINSYKKTTPKCACVRGIGVNLVWLINLMNAKFSNDKINKKSIINNKTLEINLRFPYLNQLKQFYFMENKIKWSTNIRLFF